MGDKAAQGTDPRGGAAAKAGARDNTPRAFRKRDVIILIGILVIALAAWIGVRAYQSAQTGDTVQIDGPDGLEVKLPLSQDTSYQVSTELGNNTVVISGGTVHIENADCKNHLCEEQGTISQPGQSLICLPHQLVVKIVSSDGSTATEFDGVSK